MLHGGRWRVLGTYFWVSGVEARSGVHSYAIKRHFAREGGCS